MTYILTKLAHFGITASIVSNRTISIGCECYAKSREHTYSCYANTIKAM